MFNNEMGEPPQPELTDPLKNAPWAAAALASLGLFKLLNDWESQGFSIPMMTPPSSVTNNSHIPSPLCKRRKKDSGFHPCKKLPDNPTLVHPIQLFNECYPNVEARIKKDEKKMCAIALS